MNRKTFSVGVVVILLTTMLSVLHVQPAQACGECGCGGCIPISSFTCNSITFSLPGSPEMYYDVALYDAYFNLIADLGSGYVPGDGPVTVSLPGPSTGFLDVYAHDTPFNFRAETSGLTIPSCASGANAVTWYTSPDARIDGHPGDQIAVYCNKATATTPANIDVWGIVNGDGFSLAKINVSDISQRGAGYKDGKGGAVILGGDGTNFYAAWSNSAFGANAQGDFAKTFSCTF